MKRLALVLLLILVMVSLLAAGCGDDDEEATPTPTGSPGETAPGETPTPGPAETPGPGETVTPATTLVLQAFLPEAPTGWTAENPRAFGAVTPDGEWTIAHRDYTLETTGETVRVAVYDSGYYYGFDEWQHWTDVVQNPSGGGYATSTMVGDYPAWDVYSEQDGYALVALLKAERFMVVVSSETNASLQEFSSLIRYSDIAAVQ